MKKTLSVVGITTVLFIAVLLLGPLWWVTYSPTVQAIELNQPSADFIAEREGRVTDIKPGNESRFYWADESHRQTDLVFVYIHGFSASPSEISPVVENVAQRLHANAFFPRLTAHGTENDLMTELSADDLFNDAERAYAVAKTLGKRIVLVGTSTGASLALWLAARHDDIATLILVSPNLGIKDPRGFLAAGPIGYWLARTIAGPFHNWKPRHAGQDRFWTTHYSINGVRVMTDVVNEVAYSDLSTVKLPVLCFWTPQDRVVNIEKAIQLLKSLPHTKNRFVEINTPEHVLAGQITAPENVDKVVDESVEFIKSVF